jgi:RHS repeat-associated protein
MGRVNSAAGQAAAGKARRSYQDILRTYGCRGNTWTVKTGLHYNLFRYYDPDCGRFTQQDR